MIALHALPLVAQVLLPVVLLTWQAGGRPQLGTYPVVRSIRCAISFVHGGPRVTALAALGQFIPLPNVDNTWQRLRADVQYFLTSRAGFGVGYYFEKLEIVDFNTIDTNGPVGFAPPTGDPRIDWLGGLVTGYGNRPYKGQTVYVSVLYRF